MNQDQINSMVRSVLKVAGAILVAHGATQAAAIVNCEDMIGLVITLVGLVQSHQAHWSAEPEAISECGLRIAESKTSAEGATRSGEAKANAECGIRSAEAKTPGAADAPAPSANPKS